MQTWSLDESMLDWQDDGHLHVIRPVASKMMSDIVFVGLQVCSKVDLDAISSTIANYTCWE